MHSDTHKNSDELKKEVENQIGKVTNDVQDIDKKLTPGHVVDKVVFSQFRGDRIAMLNRMKERPVGTAMFAAGLLALGQDDESRERLANKIEAKRGEYSAKAKIATSKIKDKFSGSDEDEFKSIEAHTEYNSHRFDTEDSNPDELYLSDTSNVTIGNDLNGSNEKGLGDKASEQFTHMKYTVSSNYNSAKNYSMRTFEENPTALAALGFSLGALSGGSLPVSEKESEMVHEKGDTFLKDISHDLDDTLYHSIDKLKNRFIQDLSGF